MPDDFSEHLVVRCPDCKGEFEINRKLASPWLGENQKNCPGCQSTHDGEVVFCLKCGYDYEYSRVTKIEVVRTEKKSSTPPAETRPMDDWGGILFWLLVAFLVSFVCVLADDYSSSAVSGDAVSKADVSPLYDRPYIVVYGRDRCGNTQHLLSDLNGAGVEYRYEIVDEKGVTAIFKPRLVDAGLLRSANQQTSLPVVDVNGTMMISPDLDDVLSAYQTP